MNAMTIFSNGFGRVNSSDRKLLRESVQQELLTQISGKTWSAALYVKWVNQPFQAAFIKIQESRHANKPC